MSTPEFQVGIELQLMIAHPRAPGEPEPKRTRISTIRRFFSSRRKSSSDSELPSPNRDAESQVLSADTATSAAKTTGERQWPPRNLIIPAQDDQIGFPAKRCMWKVCDTLATSGFPVACYYPFTPRRGDPVTIGMEKPNTTVVTGENGSQFRIWNSSTASHVASFRDRYWFITHEMGVTERVRRELAEVAPAGYKWFCIGIKPPRISDQRELNLRDSQCLRRLPSLGAVIHELRSELKVWTNHLCGLSIQVSPTENDFTAMTAKKAAALISLLESPFLAKFCDPRRITDNEISLISTRSRVAGGEWGHSKEDDSSRCTVRNLIAHRQGSRRLHMEGYDAVHLLLYRILTQIDLQALHDGLLEGSGSPNSFNVTTDGVAEFTYPEASLKTEYIAIWVDITRKIMETAMADEGEYGKVLGKLYDFRTGGREMGWINYWNLLGVRDKERDPEMGWVKSVANGYRGGERVNEKVDI